MISLLLSEVSIERKSYASRAHSRVILISWIAAAAADWNTASTLWVPCYAGAASPEAP